MIKKPATTATVAHPPSVSETEPQRFDRVLSRPAFSPLKAVIDQLGLDRTVMIGAIITTNSYQMFLGKLGYGMVIVPHLHEQDCYTRLGRTGGIRAVLPVHDTTTYSTMVTLVNYDSTLTTTPKSADFYDDQLAKFKIQLMNRSGDAT